MQSSREAVDNLMRGWHADFIPHADAAWADTLRKWVTQGMPAKDDGVPVDPTYHFEYDIAGIGGILQWECKLGATEILEETDEWKVVRNGSGAVLRGWKMQSGTPEHIGFHMTTREIWEKEYKPHLLDDPRKRLGNLEGIKAGLEHRKEQGKWTCLSFQFIWENLRASLGDVNMLIALLEDPDWIHDIGRTYTDVYKACLEIALEETGKPDGVRICEDLGYRDRLYCHPDILRDVIFPYYTEMVDFFKGYDIPVMLHSCGYQEPMIPLAIEAGFIGLHPMEVKAGNDILQYADDFGDSICFVGGFDVRVLERGDRGEIAESLQAFIEGMRSRRARFIFGSDHSLSRNIDYEDYLYALDIYRQHRVR